MEASCSIVFSHFYFHIQVHSSVGVDLSTTISSIFSNWFSSEKKSGWRTDVRGYEGERKKNEKKEIQMENERRYAGIEYN